ncbi:MAG: hypothetical protein QRY72_05135 [Candidatus Rhabdochlamydia sp.]
MLIPLSFLDHFLPPAFKITVQEQFTECKKQLLIIAPITCIAAVLAGPKQAAKGCALSLLITAYHKRGLSLDNISLKTQLLLISHLGIFFLSLLQKKMPSYLFPLYTFVTLYTVNQERNFTKTLAEQAKIFHELQQKNQEFEATITQFQQAADELKKSFSKLLDQKSALDSSSPVTPDSLSSYLTEMTQLCQIASSNQELTHHLKEIDLHTQKLFSLKTECELATTQIKHYTQQIKQLTEQLTQIIQTAYSQELQTSEILAQLQEKLQIKPLPAVYTPPMINAQ